MIELPNLEQSWMYAGNVLRAAVGSDNINGLSRLREQWERNKGNLLKLFGDDGRIQVDMPLELSEEMYADLITETSSLFASLDLQVPSVIHRINSDEFRENKIKYVDHDDKEGCFNMRLSKFLGRYVPEEKRDEFFVKFSMIVQKAKITGTLIVSVNPLDLLLISHNGITSCHRLGDNGDQEGPGEYATGTLQYLVDRHTVVSFLTNNNMKKIYIYNRDCGFEYPWKLWRQLCYIDLTNLSALFMRQYMHTHEDAHRLTRRVVAHAMRESIGEHSMGWIVEYPDDGEYFIDNTTELAYIDNPSSMIRLKHPNAHDPSIVLDVEPYCPFCGDNQIVTNDRLIICDDCQTSYHSCYSCDVELHEEDMLIGPDDWWYCQECYNNLFRTCCACHDVFREEDMIWFDDEWYCSSCIDDVSRCCDECGDRCGLDETKEYRGSYYCSSCYNDLVGVDQADFNMKAGRTICVPHQ